MPPTRVLVMLVLLAPLGCKKDEKLSDLFATVSDAATGVQVGDGIGTGGASVAVYATNTFGSAVAGSGTITLESDGALDTTTVDADATGWGTAAITSGVGAWSITAITGSAQADGTAYVTETEPASAGFPAFEAPARPDFVAAAGNGLVVAADNEIWWTAPDASGRTRVAALPGDILGLEAVQGEADGVADLVAWTEDAVVMLRGRSAGGLYWGGGWQTSAGAVAGVSARDLNGDEALDLAILTVEGEESAVSVYDGDGAWGFTLADRLEVPYAAWSLSAEDLDVDGSRELTLLSADSLVRRYDRFEDGWSTSGSYEYDVALAEGARLAPGVDLTADGIEDLIAYGPDETGIGHQAWIIDAGANATVFQMLNPGPDGQLPDGVTVSTAELDGDGVFDILLLTDTVLYAGFWNVVTDSFTLYSYPDVPAGNPVTAADYTGDEVTDVVIAGSQLTVLPGQRVADDPETDVDESVPWKVETPVAKVTDFLLALPPVLSDFDGDGIVDLASAATTSSGLQLQVYGGTPADADSAEGFRSRGATVLTATGTAADLAVCGADLYVTATEDTGSWLHHYRFNSSGAPVSADAPVAVGGTQIACGPLPFGEVAVAGVGGDIDYVTGTTVYTASGEPAYDAASVDVSGTREVVTCATPGCSVVAADFDGDGVEEVVTADGDSLTLSTPSGDFSVYGPGVVSTSDADGDGLPDVILADAGEVRVYRVLDGRLSMGLASYVWRPSLGPATWGDLDGDAVPDLFTPGWDYTADDATDWSGTLIYTRAVPVP